MWAVLVTAFLEGMCVLVVEIAGARALAPFFGASLHVWTAQITATLLFLALGYGLGGVLCKRGDLALPGVLASAGLWLALYPAWRSPVLHALRGIGISSGAFASSAFLFGLPLLCLGAVSPLLIARLGQTGVSGGQAAGRLFFTNTLGGLAGGWLTALLLVPHVPLRFGLAGTGVLLGLLAAAWTRVRSLTQVLTWLVPVIALAAATTAQEPRRILPQTSPDAPRVHVVDRIQSNSGLLLVLEVAGKWRNLLLNGVDQGAMDVATGTSYHPFSDYLAFMSHRYHPEAKRALLLGLGCGVLAKALHARGLEVTVVEIEPAIERAARKHFGLPSAVRVVLEDGRAFLGMDQSFYDLVILDAYTGETSPWYVLTEEGLRAAKARLAPHGRVLLNSVTRADGSSEGLKRLEATLLAVFGEAQVYLEPRLPTESADLVNATLIAGAKLVPTEAPYPATPSQHVAPFLGDMEGIPTRPARRGARIDHDDHSSLELAEAAVRMRWREKVIAVLSPDVLQD